MKDNRYTLEDIARVVHEANRAMQYVQNDAVPSPPWDADSALVHDTCINLVRLVRMGYSNEEIHQEWCDRLKDEGWTFGSVKNPQKKPHPCLVPYYDLPPLQRHKTE